jgi:hypothetical protein
MWATREASGWKIDDPVPTNAAAIGMKPKLCARESITNPTSVNAIPNASEYGLGRRSV